jgi:hypothetical protein
VESIKNAEHDKVAIPNGCCTKADCPIAQYYQVILDEIRKLQQKN